MKPFSFLFVACVLTITAPVQAEAPVEVVGVQIIEKAYGPGDNNKLVPFNSFKTGLEIALGFTVKDSGIISIDGDGSVLTKFTDDKGTNLITKEFGREGFGSFPRQSEDGKYGLISVTSSKLPAEGATKVMATGKIAVTTATTKKTERTKVIALKKGAAFTLGKINFKISDFDADDDSVKLTFETSDSLEALAEVRFIGEGNAKLEADNNGSGSFGFGGKKTYSKSYSIKGKAANIIVEGDMWQDAKKVEIPFDLSVTLPVSTSK